MSETSLTRRSLWIAGELQGAGPQGFDRYRKRRRARDSLTVSDDSRPRCRHGSPASVSAGSIAAPRAAFHCRRNAALRFPKFFASAAVWMRACAIASRVASSRFRQSSVISSQVGGLGSPVPGRGGFIDSFRHLL
jgi:hypothetical protein